MRLTSLLLLSAALVAQQAPPSPPAPRPIDDWIEQRRPPLDAPWRSTWGAVTGDDKIHDWSVALVDGHVCAVEHDSGAPPSRPGPSFSTDTKEMGGATCFSKVDDGWLVGYDHGEFGGALFWFNADGSKHEKISDHQIVDFLPTANGVLAIEGLAHMNRSQGSLIHIAHPAPGWRWVAATQVKLPAAPCAAVRRADGTLLVVLTDAIVSIDAEDRVRTLVREPALRWTINAVLTPDGQRLYVGGRRFVAQLELGSSTLRLLVPDASQLVQGAKPEAKPAAKGHK